MRSFMPAASPRTFRPAMLAMALCSAFGAAAQNLPTGAQAIAGQASVAVNGRNMLVTTTNAAGANHSAINWQSFSVGAGYSTYFQQPNATSTSINRVITSNPSQLFGTLGSNGKLVLVNPSGIAVGTGAVVDTAGFTASTLRMSDADAMAGRMRFEADASSASLNVQGQVISRGGDVVLIAPNVEVGAEGLVQSKGGAVVLAAGRKVEITGRGLEGINLEVQAPTDKAVNLGTLQGDAVAIFAGTLRHSGVIQAQTASLEGGKVVLRAQQDAQLGVGAVINADGGAGKGGLVEILGQDVKLEAGASVNVSGDAGGGTILVGGDMQGKNAAIPNAKNTNVASGVKLQADARIDGDGGKVIVWADEATHFDGYISAKGGELGGNGGNAETSGKQVLYFGGTADLSARRGRRGTLLLDPQNIIVQSANPNINGDGTVGDNITAAGDLDDAALDYPGVTSRITGAALTSLLNTTDVTLAATDLIRINAPILKTGAPITTLSLNATTISVTDTIGSTGGALNLTMNASGSATLDGRYGIGTRSTMRVTNGTLTIGPNALLDKARIGGNVALVAAPQGLLTLTNGLKLETGITFNTGAVPISIQGTQDIGTTGTATLQRTGGVTTIVGSATDFTLNPGVVWSGYGNIAGTGRLVNKGLIDANVSGQAIDISSKFVNKGQLQVEGNMVIDSARWTNTGTLVQSSGTFTLDAAGSLSSLAGKITRTGGNFIIKDVLDLQGGTLDIGSGGVLGTGGLTSLDAGGTLLNGTLVSGDNTPYRAASGTLDGMTIGGNLTMASGSTTLRNGLTLANGIVLNRAGHGLTIDSTQTIGSPGTATIASTGGATTILGSGIDLVLGSSLVWSGYGNVNGGGRLVNDGVIDVNAGATLAIKTGNFVNHGQMRVSLGTLSITPTQWSNDGTLTESGGTFVLGAPTLLSMLNGKISRSGGIFMVTNTLDLQGGTLDIGSGGVFGAGGLSSLYGGTLLNGTLLSGDGTQLASSGAINNLLSGTLDGMTIAGTLTLFTGNTTVRHGLTLADGAVLNMGARYVFIDGYQTIGTPGTASIVSNGGAIWLHSGPPVTLTLGSGLTWQGSGFIGGNPNVGTAYVGTGLINNGTINASGGLQIYAASVVNNGVMQVSAGELDIPYQTSVVYNDSGATIRNLGGNLNVDSIVTHSGLIELKGGTTNLSGNFTLSEWTSGVLRTGGSVNFMGSLDLQGGTLDVGSAGALGTGGAPGAFFVLQDGGAIRNGTLISGDGTPLYSYRDSHLWNMTIGSNLTFGGSSSSVAVHGNLVLADGVTLNSGHWLAMVTRGSPSITSPGSATLAMSGGTLSYNARGAPGVLTPADTLTLGHAVTLTGNGTILDWRADDASYHGLFVNHGTISPGGGGVAGLLTITSAMDASDGTLLLELGSTASYDKIMVRDLTFRNTSIVLTSNLPGASYLVGDSFYVLGATSITGPAPTVTGFTSTVDSGSLKLTAESAAP